MLYYICPVRTQNLFLSLVLIKNSILGEMTMLRKIAVAVICICCLFQLGGCKSDPAHQPGTPEFKANFCYEAFWYFQGDDPDAGQNVPDGYSFLCRGKIYVYSVAAQEITQVLSSKNSRIDDYAINNDYVFL